MVATGNMDILLAPHSLADQKPSSMLPPAAKRRDFDWQLAPLQRCDDGATNAKAFSHKDSFQPADPTPIQSLLRALQHSQTRAREAEKKAQILSEQREEFSRLLLEESLRLHAFKQWVRILEAEVSILNLAHARNRSSSKTVLRERGGERGKAAGAGGEGDGLPAAGPVWHLALLLCVGLAGLGFCFRHCIF